MSTQSGYIITTDTIKEADFGILVDAVSSVYTKEIPEFATDKTHHLAVLADDLVYFSNNYAFIAELWAIMMWHVRELQRLKESKDRIAAAMSKRDYLDVVLAATKLKYHAVSRLLQFYAAPDYMHGA